MSSIGLTSVGAVLGGVTLNPIILGVLAGTGVMIKGYMTHSDIVNKVERCKFAYTSYEKILIQIRNLLRGVPSDENIFMSELRFLDDMVADTCPIVSNLFTKYESKYDEIIPA